MFAWLIATLSFILFSCLQQNVNLVIGDTKSGIISTLHSVPVQVHLIYLDSTGIQPLNRSERKPADSPSNSITASILVSSSSFHKQFVIFFITWQVFLCLNAFVTKRYGNTVCVVLLQFQLN